MSDKLPQQLTTLNRAKLELAKATTVDEIKSIRDKAEAVRQYAQNAALGLDVQNTAAEVKLRAERKAGQLLAVLKLRGGDRKTKSHEATLKLEDLGINKHQSARWQLEAQVPDDQFDAYLRKMRADGGEIVAADLLRLARKKSDRRGVARTVPTPNGNGQTTNGQAVCAKAAHLAPNGHVAGPLDSDQQLQAIAHVVNELENHRALLEQILQPLYTESALELHSGQRRGVVRLLREMKLLLQQLAR